MATSFTQQNPTATMTFQNPRSSQALSPLMGRPMNGNATGLPAEIRIKILRYLLRSGDIIRSPYEVGKAHFYTARYEICKAEFDTATKLSPQVLQSCQILYEEASAILYHENEIAIGVAYATFYEAGVPSAFDVCLSFLGVGVWEPSRFDYAAEPTVLPIMQDLIERKKVTKASCTSGYDEDDCDIELALEEYNALDSWMEACTILARFQKFHVFFALNSEWDRTQVLLVCLRFRTAFFNKDVVMTIVPNWTTDASEILGCVSPCRVLRCQSLRFDLPTAVDVDEVVSAATSQEPLVDTYGMVYQLKRDIFDKLDLVDMKHFLSEHGGLWWELRTEAEEYNVPAYQRLLETLLKKARDWNQECVRRKIAIAKEEGARLEELMAVATRYGGKAIE